MATPFSCVQWASEETPVYEGAANATPTRVSTAVRYLPIQSAQPTPAPAHIDRSDEQRGILGAYPRVIDTYNPTAAISQRAYLNDLPFFFQVAGLADTVAAGDGATIKDPDLAVIPIGAFRHRFAKRTGLTAKTAQLIFAYVENNVFLQGNGFGASGVTLNADGAFTASLEGLVLKRLASDPNLSPSFDAPSILFVRRGNLYLTWYGGHGSADDFTIALAQPVVRRRSMGLNPPSYFSDKMEFGDAQTYLTGTIPVSAFAQADWDTLMTGATFALTARWVTEVNIGATTYKYSMWVEVPSAQLVDGTPDAIANRKRFGGSFSWFAGYDSTAGYDFRITVVDAVTAAGLETLA